MMIIKKSSRLWNHVPTLDELRAIADPDKDLTIDEFPDEVDLSFYLAYTGLKFFTNGKDRYRSEMKYVLSEGETIFPDYEIPKRSEFILK